MSAVHVRYLKNDWDGWKTISLSDLNECSSLSSVKSQVSARTGISVDEIRLCYEGTELTSWPHSGIASDARLDLARVVFPTWRHARFLRAFSVISVAAAIIVASRSK